MFYKKEFTTDKMKYPTYNYATGEKLYSFFFESIGEKGIVKKMVQYKEMSTLIWALEIIMKRQMR